MAFLVVVLAVLLGGIVFLSHRLAFAPRWRSHRVRGVVPVLLVVLTGLSFLQFGAGFTYVSADLARPVVWIGATWLALALYLVLGLAALALVTFLTGLVRRRDRRERSARIHRTWVPLVVIGAVAVTAYGVMRAADPRVVPVTVTSAQLPAAFDGLKVALVTDLHAGPVRSAAFTQEVVDRVNTAAPDVVLLAGDLIDGPEWRYSPTLAPLKHLEAPLGVFAVTGNHEMYSGTIAAWEEAWADLGITVLDNSSVPVTRGGATIRVAGVHDYSGTGEFAPDPAKALSGVTQEDFVLVMAHQPRAAFSLDPTRVDLQVSGHTHGGQLWPFRALVLQQQPMVDGTATVNGITVVTSRGAGTWGPPVRVGADPQIPLLTLTRG